MDENQELKERLDDLEMRYAFQQEALDSLSDVVTNQWAEIDRLSSALNVLKEQFDDAADAGPEDPDQ
ncbi:MAG TPA: SlyX family protein, partial [Pseudomonadales bacterium]|nr:SlyX family protein [Pseudomonadales bacterium]